MNEKLIQKISENDGVLEIEGFPMERSIKLNGETLSKTRCRKHAKFNESGFNWGYIGASPKQLAFAILYELVPLDEAYQYVDDFHFCIIQFLPSEYFKVYIKIDEMVQMLSGNRPTTEKKISAFKFIAVDYDGLKVPKSLDLVNLPFQSFIFESYTWEYLWLSELSTDDLKKYKEYVIKKSERFDHKASNNLTKIQIKYDPYEPNWSASGGIGTGTYSGHAVDDYEKTT